MRCSWEPCKQRSGPWIKIMKDNCPGLECSVNKRYILTKWREVWNLLKQWIVLWDMAVCVCVCVCEREREREIERMSGPQQLSSWCVFKWRSYPSLVNSPQISILMAVRRGLYMPPMQTAAQGWVQLPYLGPGSDCLWHRHRLEVVVLICVSLH